MNRQTDANYWRDLVMVNAADILAAYQALLKNKRSPKSAVAALRNSLGTTAAALAANHDNGVNTAAMLEQIEAALGTAPDWRTSAIVDRRAAGHPPYKVRPVIGGAVELETYFDQAEPDSDYSVDLVWYYGEDRIIVDYKVLAYMPNGFVIRILSPLPEDGCTLCYNIVRHDKEAANDRGH